VSFHGGSILASSVYGALYSPDFLTITSVEESLQPLDKYDIAVYPNVITAAEQTVSIEINNNITIDRALLYNADGAFIQEVHIPTTFSGSTNVPVPRVANGAYFLVFITDEGQFYSSSLIIKQ
jgi:hypothetical protein